MADDARRQEIRRELIRRELERRKQPVEAQPSTLVDMAKNGAAGIGRGAADLVGVFGSIGDVLKTGFNKGLDAVLPGPNMEDTQLAKPSPVSGQAMRGYASAATGGATDYQPKTTAGKYAGTVGEFLPGSIALGGGGVVGNALRYGVVPGLASEAAGQATKGTAYEPYARLGAAVAAPIAVGGAGRMLSSSASPGRMKSAALLEKEGVQLTAGQKTGNRNLMRKESNLNPNAADAFISKQNTAFTKAVFSKIGENADAATPEVMTRTHGRIVGMFDDLAGKHSIKPDSKLVQDLKATVDDYKAVTGQSNRSPLIENIAKDIAEEIKKNGAISGEWYKRMRTRIGKLTKNPEASDAAIEIQGALDAAMERTLFAKGSKDMEMWRTARQQYRDYLVLEKAAGGAAAETASEGILTPQMLRSASKQVYGLRNYTQGKGSLTDLARAGAGVMEKLPQSGTNLNFSGMIPGGLGAAGGATLGGAVTGGNPLGIFLGGLAGAATPRVAGSAMLSRPGRALFGNQAFSNVDVLTGRSLIPGGLLGGANVQGRQ
jgi:hypothetical protein